MFLSHSNCIQQAQNAFLKKYPPNEQNAAWVKSGREQVKEPVAYSYAVMCVLLCNVMCCAAVLLMCGTTTEPVIFYYMKEGSTHV